MTRQEAKRIVCAAVAAIADNHGENAWLTQGPHGEPLSEADESRVRAAFDELVDELRRRGRRRLRVARLAPQHSGDGRQVPALAAGHVPAGGELAADPPEGEAAGTQVLGRGDGGALGDVGQE